MVGLKGEGVKGWKSRVVGVKVSMAWWSGDGRVKRV